MLFAGKAVLRPDGTHLPITRWETTAFPREGGHYLLQIDRTPRRPDYRLLTPATGEIWEIPRRSDVMFALTHSGDGRYVLVREQGLPRFTPAQGEWLHRLFQVPGVGPRLQQRFRHRDLLSLYRRDGHVQAVLPLRADTTIFYCWLSDNGRRLVMVQPSVSAARSSHRPELHVYTW